MATSPTDHLKEIQDSLKNLPERLALVINRKSETKLRDASGRFLSADGTSGGQDRFPEKWKSSERFLGAAGKFAPGIGQAGQMLKNIRELGESWEQLQKSFTRQTPKMPTPSERTASDPRGLPLLSSASTFKYGEGPKTRMTAPVSETPRGTLRGFQHGQPEIYDFHADLRSVRDALEKNTEALKEDKADPTEDSEEKGAVAPVENKKGGAYLGNRYMEEQATKNEFRKVKGSFRPPKAVPSSKDSSGFWSKAGAAIAELL